MKKNIITILSLSLLFVSLLSCSLETPDTKPISNIKEILSSSEDSQTLSQRSFSTNEPIQVTLNKDNNIVITSYAPVTVKNVRVLLNNEPLVSLDEVYGFSQTVLPLPKGTILKENDNKFSIISKDPFMQKIETIKHPINVSFSQTTDNVWAPMSPKACREATILAFTMSYMFNHKDYPEFLKNWNAGGYKGQEIWAQPLPIVLLPSNPFKDDNGNIIEYDEVLRLAQGVKKIIFSDIKKDEPAGGIGGGNYLGVRNYIYDKFVNFENLKYDKDQQKELQYHPIETIFHEFGHVMGFMHGAPPVKGSMHYNGGWTNANYRFLRKLSSANDLPIPLDGTWENNIGFPEELKK